MKEDHKKHNNEELFCFEFTPELVDQIIFAMENQEEQFYLDLLTGVVVSEYGLKEKGQSFNVRAPGKISGEDLDKYIEDTGDTDYVNDESGSGEAWYKGSEEYHEDVITGESNTQRFEPVPEWGPANGFHLMERFVSALRNPVYKEKLSTALMEGRGVFRKFKNILKENKQIEQLWYSFKEKEMRVYVREWYERIAEKWELEKIGALPEEMEDLVLTDFVFTLDPNKFADHLEKRKKEAFFENFSKDDYELAHNLYKVEIAKGDYYRKNQTILLCMQTPLGDFAAGLEAVLFSEHSVADITLVYVEKEYRGLGLAGTLLDTFSDSCKEKGIENVIISLIGESRAMAPALAERGYESLGKFLCLKI